MNWKPSYFIAGTSTEVGKTWVTGQLAKKIKASGQSVITQKWVQTGCDGFSDDIQSHLERMGTLKEDIEPYLKAVCPYSFKHASSPHLASKLEGKHIKKEKIVTAYTGLMNHFDTVIVEGSGGILVPYTDHDLMIDIVADLHIPTLLVIENTLGAINHALLSIEALRDRKIPIEGVVFNSFRGDTDNDILASNKEAILSLGNVKEFLI